MRDKVVAITGAARGLGQEFARSLAAAGARMIAADINDCAETLDLVSARGGNGIAARLDVIDPGSARAMVDAGVKAFGRVDALINNAALYGALHGGRFDTIDEAEWDAAMAVNVKGIWNCCKAAVPAMQAGRAAAASSTSPRSPRPTACPIGLHYTTSKAAVIGLTRGLARELGRDRIRVNAVAPSAVMTEGTREFFGAQARPRARRDQSRPDDPAQPDAGRPDRHDRCGWFPTPAGSSPDRPSRSMAARSCCRGHRWRQRMQLAGKAALISGAGGGICRAIAVAFAKAGAAVACVDIDPAASAETARLVSAAGGRSLSQACDVASEAQTRAAAEAAHQAFGRLDILVSGAAPHDPSGPITEITLADWQRVLDINLTGAFLLEPRRAAA